MSKVVTYHHDTAIIRVGIIRVICIIIAGRGLHRSWLLLTHLVGRCCPRRRTCPIVRSIINVNIWVMCKPVV
jgi:hypothetical protein